MLNAYKCLKQKCKNLTKQRDDIEELNEVERLEEMYATFFLESKNVEFKSKHKARVSILELCEDHVNQLHMF